MIQLLTFPPAFGLFSSSPFCVKASYLLNLSGAAWEREDTSDPRGMPHGKLPVIRIDNGRLIAGSDRIQAYLEALGHDFDAGLSDIDRAHVHAFIRMSEEHLYFHVLLDRWGNDQIWPAVRDTYFAQMPNGLRHVIAGGVRRQVLRGMHHQGLGRLTEQERLDRVAADIDAITARLWQGAFLVGDRPGSADASLAPMLAAAAVSPGDTRLKSLVAGNDVVMKYVSRVDDACR